MEDGMNFSFWAQEIKPNGVTQVKFGNADDALHLAHACFGAEVEENSRTLLTMDCNGRSGPIAVLKEGVLENQHLDLMISGNCVCNFSVEGKNPSPVFLSGYVQPLVDAEDLGNAVPVDATGEVTTDNMEAELEPSVQRSAPSPVPPASPAPTQGVKRALEEPEEPPKKKRRRRKRRKTRTQLDPV